MDYLQIPLKYENVTTGSKEKYARSGVGDRNTSFALWSFCVSRLPIICMFTFIELLFSLALFLCFLVDNQMKSECLWNRLVVVCLPADLQTVCAIPFSCICFFWRGCDMVSVKIYSAEIVLECF